jgi:hypothetical protein
MVKCKKIIRRQTIPWLNVKRYQKTDNTMVKCKKIIRRHCLPSHFLTFETDQFLFLAM